MRFLSVISIFIFLVLPGIIANAQQNYGITIDQSSLDILTIASQVLNKGLYGSDIYKGLSINAKIIVSDFVQNEDLAKLLPDMVFRANLELIKIQPDFARINLISNFGNLHFTTKKSEALAVLPDENVFSQFVFQEVIPGNLILPDDKSGLFTLINMIGGIPFGSILQRETGIGTGKDSNISFVEELDPSDVRAVIRYRGLDMASNGLAHVITIGSALYKQYIKIWVLKDTMELCQISIEDQRGTEIFIIINNIDAVPVPPGMVMDIDTSGMLKLNVEEFIQLMALKVMSSPAMDGPIAADIYASYNIAPRTGNVTISSDGFDMQDEEDQLICEIEYKSPGGVWTPLKTEYAGLPPIGHWNAEFVVSGSAELGPYDFRVRYTDTSGNTSDWLESIGLVIVTPEPPRVTKTYPLIRESAVPVSAKISITFSKPMNKESAENAFALTSRSGKIIKGTFTWQNETMTFIPSAELEYDTPHITRIKGTATDIEGIGLDGNYNSYSEGEYYDDYIWEFVTAKLSPTLAFTPMNTSTYKGDRFDIKIMAKYVTNMYKFSFKVRFNPEFMQVENVKKGSFLTWQPAPRIAQKADQWKNVIIDNSRGFIEFSCDGTREKGVSGSGHIATISFKCISAGQFSVAFDSAVVFNYNGDRTFITLQSAEVQANEYHPSDKNKDGVVDILDLVASAEKETKKAPILIKSELGQNYPNPFNPETWIPYQLIEPSDVTIKIYKSTGELIRTINLGYKQAGFYNDKSRSAYWDGKDDNGQTVGSGIYFYTIQAGNFTATRKMLLCN